MSDDASASARLPGPLSALSERDYARMRDALTETARGRWFLDEFARRNRTADTRMVLEAVAGIENVVAAQQTPVPAPASDLADTLGRLIRRAKADLPSVSGGDTNEVLTQARRATRIIREIAWQMRGSGNDPRICNILDAQLEAIDAHVYAPASGSETSLRSRFETLLAQLEAIIDGGGVASASDVPHDVAEDDAVLARIAAEMGSGNEPDAASFDEPRSLQETPPAQSGRQSDSLGDMLIARGIVQGPTDREASPKPDHRFN